MVNVLEKIDNLRKERGWSIYKLAEESELTQSTISNMFIRQTLPTISTLSQICDAFPITLAEFFDDTQINSNDELYILSIYKQLNNRDKQIVKNLIESMNK